MFFTFLIIKFIDWKPTIEVIIFADKYNKIILQLFIFFHLIKTVYGQC